MQKPEVSHIAEPKIKKEEKEERRQILACETDKSHVICKILNHYCIHFK